MQPRRTFDRRFTIAAVALVLLIAGTLFVLLRTPAKQQTTTDQTTAPVGTSANTTSKIQYIGISDLIDRGFSDDQMTDLDFAYFKFAKANNAQYKLIKMENVEHQHDKEATDLTDSLTFTVTFDSSLVRKAKVTYSTGVSPVRLFLYDPSNGNQVYDSGSVSVPGVNQ